MGKGGMEVRGEGHEGEQMGTSILISSVVHTGSLFISGASIASWLPTFSLQLHQDGDPQLVGNDAASLHRAVSLMMSCYLVMGVWHCEMDQWCSLKGQSCLAILGIAV